MIALAGLGLLGLPLQSSLVKLLLVDTVRVSSVAPPSKQKRCVFSNKLRRLKLRLQIDCCSSQSEVEPFKMPGAR